MSLPSAMMLSSAGDDRRCIMAIAVQQIYPIVHLPLVLSVLRRLEVATVIDRFIPPHPAHGLLTGRGVEALVLAILDCHHALYNPSMWPQLSSPLEHFFPCLSGFSPGAHWPWPRTYG